MSGELTPDIVAACYRVFFGREPENENVIRNHIKNCETIDVFFRRIINLPEFTWTAQRSLVSAIRGPKMRGKVDVTGSPADMEALLAHTRAVWDKYGEEDPYYSVLTHEKYRGKDLATETRDEFYASGEHNAKALLDVCAKNGLTPNTGGTVLDLGCGLGRIGEHLSANFGHYIGIDISPSHLEQARARFAEIGRTNGTFRLLPDFLDKPDMVDVAFSVIVLQHNPPPVIAMLIAKMCEILRPGGIVHFQVPVGMFNYTFDLPTYLANPPAHGRMEMHCIPQRDVYRIFAENNCRVVETFPDGSIGNGGLSYSFLAIKD